MPAPGDSYEKQASYLDADRHPIGGLYRHRASGFEVRLLEIESVPQAFIYVGTPPVSDRGEPHTGEHLLLGKGTKGKALAAAEEMSLVESTAYTGQTEVCYSFNCAAGQETFFQSLQRTLDALLFPTYSDDEIRREVCHLAATPDPSGEGLELEEKGTVYNEMVATYEKRWIVFYELSKRLFGEGHPLGYSSGGSPDAIRTLTPEQVRRFHQDHYQLANMGVVASLPPNISAEAFLEGLERILVQLAGNPAHEVRPHVRHEVPAYTSSRDRSILRVSYPQANEQDPGYVVVAWAPQQRSGLKGHLLRRLFLEAFADGETSVLHRLLLDSEHRRHEVQATRVWGGLDLTPVSEAGMIGFTGYSPRAVSEESLREVERAVRAELDRLASLQLPDSELTSFNRRVETRLLELARGLRRRLSMPPLFGRRGGDSFWLEHLRLVDRAGGRDRSLVLTEGIQEVCEALATAENPWREVIDELGLRDAPIVAVSIPSSDEIKLRALAREERLSVAMQRLQVRLGATTPSEALERLYEEQEEISQRLAERDRSIASPRLVPDVPRTLDEGLVWGLDTLGGIPCFRAEFSSMSAVEMNLYFDVRRLSRDELLYLPLLPSLFTGVGLRSEQGERLAYDELRELLEREIGDLSASFELRPDRGRYELRISGSGTDLSEGRRALYWMQRCLLETDLSSENLPRLRDLVRQRYLDLRGALGRSEESWVRNPALALRFQDDLLYLSAASIHTRLYHMLRLRWVLAAPPEGADRQRSASLFALARQLVVRAGAERALEVLRAVAEGESPAELDWPELAPLLPALRSAQDSAFWSSLGVPLVEDLAGIVRDLPAEGLGPALQGVLVQLAGDLATPPAEGLESLRGLMDRLTVSSGARLVLTSKGETLDALRPQLEALLGVLARRTGEAGEEHLLSGLAPVVTSNLRKRHPGLTRPVHFGLVHETASSGVFVLSSRLAPLVSHERERLLELLAGSVHSGGGPHGYFMKTWSAGLAYSNGLRVSPLWGRISYYAERCPDLAATMRFVVEQAKAQPRAENSDFAEYALAQLVSHHRASDRFETRSRAQAADLVDGITPEAVAAQREALLALREEPGLAEVLSRLQAQVEGRALVGLGPPTRELEDAVYLTIAPERLLTEWEAYVQEAEGAEERVYRIYPADFWIA